MIQDDRPGPRIARLPAGLQSAALAVRPLVRMVRKITRRLMGGEFLSDYAHRSDRMATKSIVGFLEDREFQRAYARAVKAGGWDYSIPYRVHQALWCSKRAQQVPGDYLELGTGRGFVMSAVLEAYPEWNTDTRSAYLFDTFEQGWVTSNGRGRPSRYYAESVQSVIDNFAQWDRVNAVVGDVYQTLPVQPITQIAFLHLDLNAAEPEVWALKTLWHKISPGGIVLLDDFANLGRQVQHDAITALSKELGFEILYTASGQGIVIR